jgi:mono/diheme cytochrome c family protein
MLAFPSLNLHKRLPQPAAAEVTQLPLKVDPVKGKELFNANCAACHKLDAKATGPMLRGIAAMICHGCINGFEIVLS